MANTVKALLLNFWTFLTQLSVQHKVLLGLFVVAKILLILMVPLTGDEAYFITWGQNLSLGYYDHPPAVGWLLYFLGWLSDDLTWYRSFAFVAAIVIAYLLYKLVRLNPKVSNNTATWVALAFFVSPISLMFVVTANDTVLVFFALLGLYFFAKAIQSQRGVDVVLAGLFLAFAFLSKYFAAFMLLGLLAYALWYWKHLNLKQLLIMVAMVLLAVAENLYFNATHCWNNILFNFFSRTTQSQFEIQNVLLYIAMIGLLLSPLGIMYLIKNKAFTLFKEAQPNHFLQPNVLVLFASLPLLAILLLVSFTNKVGLHWPLISVTALYALYVLLTQAQLKKLFVFNAYFSLVIAGGLLLALSQVDRLISPSQKHHVAVYTQPQTVCAVLPKNQTLFTLDYSSQSALSYHCANDNIHVFASQSKYGREDDKLTNFKKMDGQALVVFVTQEKDIEKIRPYFSQLTIKTLPISSDLSYYLVTGRDFNYTRYRQEVLIPVNRQFYHAPDWFPTFSEGCAFKKKYDLPS